MGAQELVNRGLSPTIDRVMVSDEICIVQSCDYSKLIGQVDVEFDVDPWESCSM